MKQILGLASAILFPIALPLDSYAKGSGRVSGTSMKFLTLVALGIVSVSALGQSVDSQISSFTTDQQVWLDQTCPKSFGPSLWRSCMDREITALRRGIPRTNLLGESDRRWISETCPASFGPSLMKNCIERESNALQGGMPSISSLSPQNRAWISETCPRSFGPSLYKSCVLRESGALR